MDGEADRGAHQGVDAREQGRIDLREGSRLEVFAAHEQAQALGHKHEHRAPVTAGHGLAEGREQRAHELDGLVDASAAGELRHRATALLGPLERVHLVGEGQEQVGGLARVAQIDQLLGQGQAQLLAARRVGVGPEQLEGLAVGLDREREGEGLGGLPRAALGVVRRLDPIPRLGEVAREGLGVGPQLGQHRGQAQGQARPLPGLEPLQRRLAHARMSELEGHASACLCREPEPEADGPELRAHEQPAHDEPLGEGLARLARLDGRTEELLERSEAQRGPGEGEQLEELAPGGLDRGEATREQLIELELGAQLRPEHELDQPKGAALGPPREDLGAGGVRGLTEQRQRQRHGLGVRERAKLELAQLTTGKGRRIVELAQGRAQLELVAKGEHQQQRRGLGRTQERGEQAHAVDVGPLKVIDADDQRLAITQTHDQLAQTRQTQAPPLRGRERGLRRAHPLPHVGEHGEELDRRARVAGLEARGLDRRQAAQVDGERVDDGVEALVGHRLALEAAPRQDQRRLALAQLGLELAQQGRLPGPARTVHEHGHRGAGLPDVAQRRAQAGELGRAPDEGPRAPRADAARPRRAPAPIPEGREQLAARRAQLRLGLEQPQAQLAQLGRDPGHAGARVRELAALLGQHHLHRRARERPLAAQALVEHHAEGVVVRGGPRAPGHGLLRRHVGRGPEQLSVVGHPLALSLALRDQAEIEDHDAPAAIDEHVRGLEVAVDASTRVELEDALDELLHHPLQPLEARQLGAGRPPAHVARQPLPVDELHREEGQARGRDHELVEAHEVLVLDVSEGPKLALEAVEVGRTRAPEDLEGHACVVAQARGREHLAHASGPDPTLEAVTAELLPELHARALDPPPRRAQRGANPRRAQLGRELRGVEGFIGLGHRARNI